MRLTECLWTGSPNVRGQVALTHGDEECTDGHSQRSLDQALPNEWDGGFDTRKKARYMTDASRATCAFSSTREESYRGLMNLRSGVRRAKHVEHC
jgi:hypothetical protein